MDRYIAEPVIDYLDEASCYLGSLARHTFMLINHHDPRTRQQINQHLQQIGNIKSRTANSIYADMEARHSALRELKKTELEDLETRIQTRQERLQNDRETVNTLKILVSANCPLSEECMDFYRNLKQKIWRSARKLDTMLKQKEKLERQIASDTYSLCFGTKKLFREQWTLEESGWKDHGEWRKEWVSQRQKGLYYLARGEETNGNQQCHLEHIEKDLFRLTVLHHTKGQKIAAVGIIRLPYMTNEIIWQLKLHESGSPYAKPLSARFVRRQKGWYAQFLLNVRETPVYTNEPCKGVVGVDFNSGFLSVSETDSKGNLVHSFDIPVPSMGLDCEKRTHELRIAAKKITEYAAVQEKPIAVETLNFSRKKAKTRKGHGKRYNRMLHGLSYSAFYEAVERRCKKDGVELIPVSPAYTSQGAKKYLSRMKLTVHRGAAWMIARRAMGYRIDVKKSEKQAEHEKAARKIGKQKKALKEKKKKLVTKRITALKKKQLTAAS